MKWIGILLLVVLVGRQASAQLPADSSLYVINELYTATGAIELWDDSILHSFLTFTSITPEEYWAQQRMAASNVIVDTLSIWKINDTLHLPLEHGEKIFVDTNMYIESREEYNYLGTIPKLYVYLVQGVYWEEYDYKWISMLDGSVVFSFSGYPHISGDLKYVISLYADPYDMETELIVCSLKNNIIQPEFGAAFKNWMPSADDNKVFWGADGNLYVPYQQPSKFWNENGDFNEDYKYLKVELFRE